MTICSTCRCFLFRDLKRLRYLNTDKKQASVLYVSEMAREIQILNKKFQTIDSEYGTIIQSKQVEIDVLTKKLKEAKKQTKDDVLLNELQRLRENEHELVHTVQYA